MKHVICITEKEYRKARLTFEAADDLRFVPASYQEPVLAEIIAERNARVAVLGVEPYVDQLYAALPKGGLIARFGVGYDGIDKARATAAGIAVTNTPEVLNQSVAEHTIWLLGAIARRIAAQHGDIKAGLWKPTLGYEVHGKTILILGCGKIGCMVARIAAFGFGMTVVGFDVAPLDPDQMKQQCGFDRIASSLDDALAQADFVSLHLPALPATENTVNPAFLQRMKPSACLINTARGSLVDEVALYDALVSRSIAGAALDVYAAEPYQPARPDKDFRRLPHQVLLTPHVASSTAEASARIAQRVIANIRACIEHRYQDLDLLNPDVITSIP